MATKWLPFPFVLFLTLTVEFVVSDDLVLPTNAAGQTGEPLEINCTYGVDRTVGWNFRKLGGGASTPIYQDRVLEEYKDTYEAGNIPDNIIIKDLKYETAGKYTCNTIDGMPPTRNIAIQVASASKLACSKNSDGPQNEGDTPKLSCVTDVSSNSQLKPHFQWYENGEEIEGWIQPAENTPAPGTPEGFEFVYNLTVTAEHHQVPFECRVRFKYDGSSEEGVDDSDPIYEDSCSLAFDVRFHPKDVHIYPSSHDTEYLTMQEGERLNCTARGTEPLTYQWFQQDGGTIYHAGQYLEVTNEMVEYNKLIFNCTVENTINGQEGSGHDQVIFYAIPSEGSAIHFGTTLWILVASAIFMTLH